MTLAAGVKKIAEKMRRHANDQNVSEISWELLGSYAESLLAMVDTHAPSVEVEPLGPTTAERLDRAEAKLRSDAERINALEKAVADLKRWGTKAAEIKGGDR